MYSIEVKLIYLRGSTAIPVGAGPDEGNSYNQKDGDLDHGEWLGGPVVDVLLVLAQVVIKVGSRPLIYPSYLTGFY